MNAVVWLCNSWLRFDEAVLRKYCLIISSAKFAVVVIDVGVNVPALGDLYVALG